MKQIYRSNRIPSPFRRRDTYNTMEAPLHPLPPQPSPRSFSSMPVLPTIRETRNYCNTMNRPNQNAGKKNQKLTQCQQERRNKVNPPSLKHKMQTLTSRNPRLTASYMHPLMRQFPEILRNNVETSVEFPRNIHNIFDFCTERCYGRRFLRFCGGLNWSMCRN